jgi:hypothetical protein
VDFITLVLLCAPDRFIKQDFLPDDEQWNLAMAFDVLRDKFHLVEERLNKPELAPELRKLLEASQAAYKAGEVVKGAHTIQDFRKLILDNARRGRA